MNLWFWNFQPIEVSIFYPEQHHSVVTCNEHRNLFVAIADLPVLKKNLLPANARYALVQAIILTDPIGKKILAWWSYNYRLLKYTYTTQVTI